MIWLLLACATETERYAQALKDGPEADCSQIQAPQMQGDCLAWKARHQGQQGDLAGAAVSCGSVVDPIWRAECWFLVSDSLEAVGQAAVTLCARSGEFEEECLGHSTNRALTAALDERGQEAQALATTEATWLAFYGDPERARRKAEGQLVTGLLRRRRPFTKAGFGSTPPAQVITTLALHFKAKDCQVVGVDQPSLAQWIPLALEEAGCAPPAAR